METKIFKNYEEFKQALRESDTVFNGVDKMFARLAPDYEDDNKTNSRSWNCLRSTGLHSCNTVNESANCWDCIQCNRCTDCDSCDNVNDGKGLRGRKNVSNVVYSKFN